MKKLILRNGHLFYTNQQNQLKGTEHDFDNYLKNRLKLWHLLPVDDCCEDYTPPPPPLAEVIYFDSNMTIDNSANGKIYVYDGTQDPVDVILPTTAQDPTIPIGTSFKVINSSFSVMRIIGIGGLLTISTLDIGALSEQYGEYTCTKLNNTDWIVTQG